MFYLVLQTVRLVMTLSFVRFIDDNLTKMVLLIIVDIIIHFITNKGEIIVVILIITITI